MFIFTIVSSGLHCQISGNPISNIPCSSTQTTTTFYMGSGQAPYTLTVTTPSCTASYSLSGLTANTTVTFGCVGVYSISAKDASSTLVGSTTHTVTLDTTVSYGIDIYFVSGTGHNDTICLGTSMVLRGGQQPSPPNYTLSNFKWNTGDTVSLIQISPNVTSNYSFTALYTSVYSKTCTAEADTTVVVVSCATGVNERNFSNLDVKIFPNPVIDKLYLSFTPQQFHAVKLRITNLSGENVYSLETFNTSSLIDLSGLPTGFYFLRIETDSDQKSFKLIKE